MATFVVCTRCSQTLEIAGIDQLPEAWQRAGSAILCPPCAGANEEAGDVVDEEVIYPVSADDTFDDGFDE